MAEQSADGLRCPTAEPNGQDSLQILTLISRMHTSTFGVCFCQNLGGVTFSQGLVSHVKSSISVRSVCAGPSLCRKQLHMPVDITLTSPDGGHPAEPYASNGTADMFYQSLEAVALQ